MQTFPPHFEAYRASSRNEAVAGDLDPEVRSGAGYVRWLLRYQWPLLVGGTVFTSLFFIPGAFSPWMIGKAIDAGIDGRVGETVAWCVGMLALIIAGAAIGVVASSFRLACWLNAMFTSKLLVVRKVLQLGHVVTRRAPTGEVLSVAASDTDNFGALAEVTGRTLAAFAAFLMVSVLVLTQSVPLGLIVLVSAPMLVFSASPVMGPLQRAQMIERNRSSRLTGMATDIVAGLRILRGIGGEQTFGDNYAQQSQSVRFAGVRTGRWQAVVQAMATLLSGLLLVLLTWAGVGELMANKITVGQLISFFGYAIFLVEPMQTMFEFAMKWAAAVVSARKTTSVLRLAPPWLEPSNAGRLDLSQELVDSASGLVVPPGKMTVLVSAVPDETAALADRIGRYLPPVEAVSLNLDEGMKGKRAKRQREERERERADQAAADERRAVQPWGVSVGGVDLTDVSIEEVRRNILVSDTGSLVFAGTLQSFIDPKAEHTRLEAEEVIRVASAEDVYDLMPGGWQGMLDERGRGLSGGQRQRLVLARALLANPEMLVLVEPTSAVDAHTEARIAERLADHRRGRTTVVSTVSPLILRHADNVVLVRDGRVAETGTHEHLMASSDAYRQVVARGAEEDA